MTDIGNKIGKACPFHQLLPGADHDTGHRTTLGQETSYTTGRTAIRNQEKFIGLPILVVTTRNSKADVVTAIKEGANNYVVKPFGPSTLSEKITKVLQAVGQGVGA